MNRPLWLDILYVGSFFIPPVVIAAAITVVLGQWLGWSYLVMGLVYLVSVFVSLGLWLGGLVLWSRRSPKLPGKGDNEST